MPSISPYGRICENKSSGEPGMRTATIDYAPQQMVEEVNRLGIHIGFVLRGNEALPWLARVPSDDTIVARIQL